MPITISSIEQKIFFPADTLNVPCHEDLTLRPVIYYRGENDQKPEVSNVICSLANFCQFPNCRFKNPCEI